MEPLPAHARTIAICLLIAVLVALHFFLSLPPFCPPLLGFWLFVLRDSPQSLKLLLSLNSSPPLVQGRLGCSTAGLFVGLGRRGLQTWMYLLRVFFYGMTVFVLLCVCVICDRETNSGICVFAFVCGVYVSKCVCVYVYVWSVCVYLWCVCVVCAYVCLCVYVWCICVCVCGFLVVVFFLLPWGWRVSWPWPDFAHTFMPQSEPPIPPDLVYQPLTDGELQINMNTTLIYTYTRGEKRTQKKLQNTR